MHIACMATKTISLRIEAYEKLRRARRFPEESFSEVVLRASWPGETVTGKDLLRRTRERGAYFTEQELDHVAEAKRTDSFPEDKWDSR
jgi:hypothetical protein